MTPLGLFALLLVNTTSKAYSLPSGRINARIRTMSGTISATDLFSAWAIDGRDINMSKGHGNAVFEMLTKAQNLIEAKQFSFIDVVCGNGWAVEAQATNSRISQSIGIDGATEMIKKAKRTSIEKQELAKSKHELAEPLDSTLKAPYAIPTSYHEHDITTFIPPNKFDCAFSMEVLYYLSEDQVPEFLKSINSNYLTENGLFVMGIDHYEVRMCISA
jgi:predicted TPR repeat methyltransferase